MLEQDMLIAVRNISDGPVVYSVPELNIRREYLRGEQKNVPAKEIRGLFYTAGGAPLIREYLCVDNKELLAEFGIQPEPEYYWTEADVRNLLLNEPLDKLLDCLDYAPEGIVELVKTLAVTLKINDMSKRHAIYEATGLDINKAISINEVTEEVVEAPKTSGRRVPVDTNK